MLDAVGNVLWFPSLTIWEAHPFELEGPRDGFSECVYRAMVFVARLRVVPSEVFDTDGTWEPASKVVVSFASFQAGDYFEEFRIISCSVDVCELLFELAFTWYAVEVAESANSATL